MTTTNDGAQQQQQEREPPPSPLNQGFCQEESMVVEQEENEVPGKELFVNQGVSRGARVLCE